MDTFRSHFKIDCVLFPPDQVNREYTKLTDVWMCVTDWKTPSTIMKEGLSDRFAVAKVCVLADEEFYDVDEGIKRKAHLNPGGRLPTNDADVAKLVANRYLVGDDWVRIES